MTLWAFKFEFAQRHSSFNASIYYMVINTGNAQWHSSHSPLLRPPREQSPKMQSINGGVQCDHVQQFGGTHCQKSMHPTGSRFMMRAFLRRYHSPYTRCTCTHCAVHTHSVSGSSTCAFGSPMPKQIQLKENYPNHGLHLI